MTGAVVPMVVDFAFKKTPAYRVAYIRWKGPWSDRRIRSEFSRLAQYARKCGGRTGHWFFREPGTRQWEVALEVRGPKVRPAAPMGLKTYPATRVASVVFDPEAVSPQVVYHGLMDWLRWRRKEGKVRSVGSTREVYDGNPYTDAKAWSRTDVQFLVR
jgi:effector-binding domain-containing protein